MANIPADALPDVLARRVRSLRAAPFRRDGRYVLYAMAGNLRATENHALASALTLANAAGLPLLVALELTETYPYANDRHHRFLLDGMRYAKGRIDAMGIRAAAFVHRPGNRENATCRLVRDAALVVCDDLPTWPYRAARADVLAATMDDSVPVVAVDASCVVPMRATDGPYARAFAYRKATKAERHDRLRDNVPEVGPSQPVYADDLPVRPTDLDAWDLGALTAACAVDHGVPPVPEFPGGEAAALARWTDFRDNHLSTYATLRNDALRDDGVSKLSPYLRHGMIAATRIAREAAAQSGKGAEKFLDELLIWREMSWCYAFHEPDHDSITMLPQWARESLDRRTLDPRPVLYSWETLSRSRTSDTLWNAAQAGYRVRGYLHNNVRMTWGKAVLSWTNGPEDAAAKLLDLNNRYALDGGDPNSFQGLFWCLGAFDRPFTPEQPIFGAVRARTTERHAQRLDPDRFAALQTRYPGGAPLSVGVVGAGVAGLMCARTLADHGADVTVFDKGRHAGGRLATRDIDGRRRVNHGAPWFTVADPRLVPYLQSWTEIGVLAPISGADRDTLAAHPDNRAFAAHLAADLDVRSGRTVVGLEADKAGWTVRTESGAAGPFDRIVVAVPAPQAVSLLERAAPDLAERAQGATYDPCWTAMIALDEPLGGTVGDVVRMPGPVQLALRATHPQANGAESWVLHADPVWATANLEGDRTRTATALRDAFTEATGVRLPGHTCNGHRWRYATVRTPLGVEALFDSIRGVGACGDWCPGGGVGGALVSGVAMAGRIFASEPVLAARAGPLR
jgi:photolyase PhrII